MSHHGPNPFDDEEARGHFERILRDLKDTASYRGPIGSFPAGHLTKADEGAIQFAIGEKDGKVVLDFGAPTAWIGMTAQEAADLASALLRRAREVGRKQGQMIHVTIGG